MKPVSMTDDLAALAAGFPAWHIWRGRSAAGRETDWHATHKRPGDRRRLTAPDAEGLRALLAWQEALEAVPA
jgi:hypothetical protein